VVCIVESVILGSDHPTAQQQKLNSPQQHAQSLLSNKIAESEALLALRDSQIEGMKQEIQRNQLDMQNMRQRLDMFDDVLAARKVAGVHFLKPSATWKNDHTIAYQLILVKGKNYPRWIIGHLTFIVENNKGHPISLQPAKKANNGSSIEMTTQTFIEGTLAWQQTWRPKTLIITLINHKGRNKGSITIPITPNRP